MSDIVILSPYHGGSHRAWAEGYQQHSQETVRLLTLPDRFWKWRMHGGAITLAGQYRRRGWQPDVILATDMLDLTTFLALTRRQTGDVPTAIYMHENQVTYPLPADGSTGPMRRQLGERDQHYAFINFASMLAADRVLFNSDFHRQSLLEALPNFLKHFPEYNELDTLKRLSSNSLVLPVGIDLKQLQPSGALSPPVSTGEPPLIVWNQRWEYDKNPEAFFQALYKIQAEGLPFRLALCGQQFGRRPSVFDRALKRLSREIIHTGHAELAEYHRLLWESSLTISTSHHEFFGISILEAIACQTFPILPYRLSYPELIPEEFHLRCLYRNSGGLLQRIRWALTHPDDARDIARQLAGSVQKYDWRRLASRYDTLLGELSQISS